METDNTGKCFEDITARPTNEAKVNVAKKKDSLKDAAAQLFELMLPRKRPSMDDKFDVLLQEVQGLQEDIRGLKKDVKGLKRNQESIMKEQKTQAHLNHFFCGVLSPYNPQGFMARRWEGEVDPAVSSDSEDSDEA